MKNIILILIGFLSVSVLSAQVDKTEAYDKILTKTQSPTDFKVAYKAFNTGDHSLENILVLYDYLSSNFNADPLLSLKVAQIGYEKHFKRYQRTADLYVSALKRNGKTKEAQEVLETTINQTKDQELIDNKILSYQGVLLNQSSKNSYIDIQKELPAREEISNVTHLTTHPTQDYFFEDTKSGFNIVSRLARKKASISKMSPSESTAQKGISSVTFYDEDTYYYVADNMIYFNTVDDLSSARKIPFFQKNKLNLRDPFVVNIDGSKVLFFATDDLEGFGGYDIFYMIIEKGKESLPVNAGATVNSEYDEINPYFDGTHLIYSSNNLTSMGGFDLYKSYYEGIFYPSTNLGQDINSVADEFDFIWLEKDKRALFVSNVERYASNKIYEAIYKPLPSVVLQLLMGEGQSSEGVSYKVGSKKSAELLDPESLLSPAVFWLDYDKEYFAIAEKEGFHADTTYFTTEGLKHNERLSVQIPLLKILAQGNNDPSNFTQKEKWLEGEVTILFDGEKVTERAKSEIKLIAGFLEENPKVYLDLVACEHELVDKRVSNLMSYLTDELGLTPDKIGSVASKPCTKADALEIKMVRDVEKEDFAVKKMDENEVTSIEFEELTYDFGTLKEGDKVEHLFKFTNTGDFPFVVEYAGGSCGCTVPDYPLAAIQPGESSQIKVTFDSTNKEIGDEETSVTLIGNVAEKVIVLKVKAHIIE